MPSRTPPASSGAALNRMKAVRQRGTDAEERIAAALQSRGIPFESNIKVLEEHRYVADIVIRDHRIAIFVDGCFWHGCPVHGTRSKSNSNYWDEKIAANKRRDQHALEVLTSSGWRPVRVWAHEDANEVATLIHRLILSDSDFS